MIKYLSGELSREESRAFEAELSENKALRESFDRVSAAYNLIGDQLNRRDEEAFTSRLREAMDRPLPGNNPLPGKRKPRWLLLLPLAASVAIFLAIILMNREEELHLAFYNPAGDPVILAINQETRGDSESMARLFTDGEYSSVMEKSTHLLTSDPGNRMALLFRLLSAMEMELQNEVLAGMEESVPGSGDSLGQALVWYRVLALIKANRTEEAADALEVLLVNPGPYGKNAHKLQKKLKK